MDQIKYRVHVNVEGRVQGVGFRAFVEDAATHLGLTGWVRNRWNGTVESVAEGSKEDLNKFISLVERGPRSAQVTHISSEWEPASGEFIGFFVRKTD